MAPDREIYEVTVFGRGYGEAIVVHSHGAWFLIDSFIDPESSQGLPIAQRYLDALGVGDDAVKLQVVTHWHDDHVAGIAANYRRYSNSAFACAHVMTTTEFIAFAEVYAGISYDGAAKRSRLSEWKSILQNDDFAARRTAVGAGTSLWRNDAEGFELYALSPSGAELTSAQAALAKMLPQGGEQQLRPPANVFPNHAAIAIVAKLGDRAVLLGSDLEVTADRTSGWHAAVDKLISQNPSWKSFLYKVAHHGSETAELDEIWSEALSPNPISVYTHFLNGSVTLPKPTDVARIKDRSSEVLAASAISVQRRTANSDANLILGRAGIKLVRNKPKVGAVRIRWRSDDPATSIELFGVAS